jgi:ATP-dependent helicase Lhr and Lhr-like helicase
VSIIDSAAGPSLLPSTFAAWFSAKGWQPRAHQMELLTRATAGESLLLIAPTGAGKTLAGFLPALTDLTRRGRIPPGSAFTGIHTLYISPLKALAVDIERNLMKPVEEMGLPITIETRTGDTPQAKRQRQRLNPPDILLTTPEQVALLIANGEAPRFFKDLKYVIFDELHSLVTSKRGHLLSLGLARMRQLAPGLRTIGLSATVAEPMDLRRWLVEQRPGEARHAGLVTAPGGARPIITILKSKERVPWSGHSAKYAMPEVYEAIRDHKTSLLFVNTRSQAEILFQELWNINEDTLPIALHHARLKPPWRKTACAPLSPHRRSTSASTGATSISSSMSARRRAPRGLPSASAAPTTAWTNRAGRSSYPPTASR